MKAKRKFVDVTDYDVNILRTADEVMAAKNPRLLIDDDEKHTGVWDISDISGGLPKDNSEIDQDWSFHDDQWVLRYNNESFDTVYFFGSRDEVLHTIFDDILFSGNFYNSCFAKNLGTGEVFEVSVGPGKSGELLVKNRIADKFGKQTYKGMDVDMLSQVKPDHLCRYLETRGWVNVGIQFPEFQGIAVFRNGNEELLVPQRVEFVDYSRRIGDAVSLLGELEHRNCLEILSDLINASPDK